MAKIQKFFKFRHIIILIIFLFCFNSQNHRYAEKGLRILAFPCNQFGGQEPGSNEEIKKFAKGYDVKFDMFSKIDVNGANADPLYVFLKNAKHGTLTNNIKWNFTKFLCDKHGVPVKRYSPTTKPLDISKDIENELSKA